MKVDGELAGTARQLVQEGDRGALPRTPPDRRPREGPVVGPHLRLGAGKDPDLGLANRDPDVRVIDDSGDRQATRKWGRGERAGSSARQRRKAPRSKPRGQ